MKYLKFYFTCITWCIACVILSNNTFSQEKNKDWLLYDEVNGVQFFYKYAECHNIRTDKHIEYILLQMINTTSETMEVEWKRDMWYNNECLNCNSTNPEYIHTITLEPGQEFTAECDSKSREIKIFSKFLNFKGPELTKFELTHIKVMPK